MITFMDDVKPKGVPNVCTRVNVLYKLEEGLSVERLHQDKWKIKCELQIPIAQGR